LAPLLPPVPLEQGQAAGLLELALLLALTTLKRRWVRWYFQCPPSQSIQAHVGSVTPALRWALPTAMEGTESQNHRITE